jgi:GNAT superfamily N-acetyltransferase
VPDVTAESLDGPAGRELLAELDQDLNERYGDDETVNVHPEEFLPPDGIFLVVRDGEEPLACGGYRRIADDTAEIKRMYVRPQARGKGLARLVLARLEESAGAAGYRQLWLETGLAQPEAMALYESSGYQRIAPFGQFSWAPDQRCYGKVLAPTPSNRAPLS